MKILLPGITGGSQNIREEGSCHLVKTRTLPVGLPVSSPVCLPQDFQKTAGKAQREIWGWHYRWWSIKCVLPPAPPQFCGPECSPEGGVVRSLVLSFEEVAVLVGKNSVFFGGAGK